MEIAYIIFIFNFLCELFRSFAYFIYGDPSMHLVVRKECYDYMIQERNFFEQFADNELDAYVSKQRQPNIWGDEIEILALAERYNKRVQVFSLGMQLEYHFLHFRDTTAMFF